MAAVTGPVRPECDLAVAPDGLTLDRFGPPFDGVPGKQRTAYQDPIDGSPKIEAVAKGMAEHGLNGDSVHAHGAELAVKVAPLASR